MDKQFWKLKEVSEIWNIETDVLLEMCMNERFNLLFYAKGAMRLVYQQLGEVKKMTFESEMMLKLNPEDSKKLRLNGDIDVFIGYPIEDIHYIQVENEENAEKRKFYDGTIELETLQASTIFLLESLHLTSEDIWVHQIDKKEFEEINELDLKVENKVIKNITKKGYRSPLKQLIDEVDQEIHAQIKKKPPYIKVWNKLKNGKYDIIIKGGFYELIWYNGEINKKIKLTVFKKYLSEIRRDRREAKNPS